MRSKYAPLNVMLLIIAFVMCKCVDVLSANARQIRINRYDAGVSEDDSGDNILTIQATVREVKPISTLTPYPAAGYRPGRVFVLPTETTTQTASVENHNTTPNPASELITTTTELAEPLSSTTVFEGEGTTTYNVVSGKVDRDNIGFTFGVRKTPYPAAGYRPYIAFNLPAKQQAGNSNYDTAVVNAPTTITTATQRREKSFYPVVEYGPNRVLRLPIEEQQVHGENVNQDTPQTSNNNHPACGVSDNPVAPTPPAGAKDDPDAERVLVRVASPSAMVGASLPVRLSMRARPVFEVRS